MNIELSEEAISAIRYALRVAKAVDEMAHAQAEFTYKKDRMAEIEDRIYALDEAFKEIDR